MFDTGVPDYDVSKLKNVHIMTEEEMNESKRDVAGGHMKPVGCLPGALRDHFMRLTEPVDIPGTVEELLAGRKEVRDDV